MNSIRIAIEGAAADEAARALFEIEGLSGEYAVDEEVTKDGGLTVIATVIGIVGGTMAIAEQIRQWYELYKNRAGAKTIGKVLIRTSERRILLDNASTEDIEKVLKVLAK